MMMIMMIMIGRQSASPSPVSLIAPSISSLSPSSSTSSSTPLSSQSGSVVAGASTTEAPSSANVNANVQLAPESPLASAIGLCGVQLSQGLNQCEESRTTIEQEPSSCSTELIATTNTNCSCKQQKKNQKSTNGEGKRSRPRDWNLVQTKIPIRSDEDFEGLVKKTSDTICVRLRSELAKETTIQSDGGGRGYLATCGAALATSTEHWRSNDDSGVAAQSTTKKETAAFSPKRPMNAFMVWAQAVRRELHRCYSNVQNATLSKVLGKIWHQMGELEREPFLKRANIIKVNHKLNYPQYKYQPRRINDPLQGGKQAHIGNTGNNNNNIPIAVEFESCQYPKPTSQTTYLVVGDKQHQIKNQNQDQDLSQSQSQNNNDQHQEFVLDDNASGNFDVNNNNHGLTTISNLDTLKHEENIDTIRGIDNNQLFQFDSSNRNSQKQQQQSYHHDQQANQTTEFNHWLQVPSSVPSFTSTSTSTNDDSCSRRGSNNTLIDVTLSPLIMLASEQPHEVNTGCNIQYVASPPNIRGNNNNTINDHYMATTTDPISPMEANTTTANLTQQSGGGANQRYAQYFDYHHHQHQQHQHEPNYGVNQLPHPGKIYTTQSVVRELNEDSHTHNNNRIYLDCYNSPRFAYTVTPFNSQYMQQHNDVINSNINHGSLTGHSASNATLGACTSHQNSNQVEKTTQSMYEIPTDWNQNYMIRASDEHHQNQPNHMGREHHHYHKNG